MKYAPGIAAVVVQQTTTVIFMEFVRRDLLLAIGVAGIFGLAVYFLIYHFQGRHLSRQKTNV
jgi:hypothetical protein